MMASESPRTDPRTDPRPTPAPAVQWSEDYLHRIAQEAAEAAARRAVADVLDRLGFDAGDPRSVRRDADWLRDARIRSADPEYQKDRLFLRRQREAHDSITRNTRRAVLTALVGGAIAAVWLGVQETLR